jgi:hypothetical protein
VSVVGAVLAQSVAAGSVGAAAFQAAHEADLDRAAREPQYPHRFAQPEPDFAGAAGGDRHQFPLALSRPAAAGVSSAS